MIDQLVYLSFGANVNAPGRLVEYINKGICIQPFTDHDLSQILELARQLSDEDKLELNRALAAEVRGIKLKRLLDDLKTDEVLQEDIDSEVETVRQENYEKRLQNENHC